MAYNFSTDVYTLRLLINDIDSSNYQYTNCQLTQMLLFGARLVLQEFNSIDTEYTITIDFETPNYDISPDPDDLMSNLMILKAACLINQAQMTEKSIMDGIKASCGPASVSMISSGSAGVYKFLSEYGACALYEKLKHKTEVLDAFSNFSVKGILTPYIDYYGNICSGGRYGCGN